MKVLLVNPSLSRREQQNPVIANLFSNAMPLGLAYLASTLLARGHQVHLRDGAAERVEHKAILNQIERERYSLVGITSTTTGFHRALEFAGLVRERFPSITTVLGGPHLSALPYHAMAEKSFDLGVMGEGEETLAELVEVLEGGGQPSQVKGLIYREGDEIKFTPPRPLIQNLDTIPFPARHLLNTRLYASLPTDVRFLPKFTVITARGCPFRCIFCDSAVVGKKHRTPSPEYLVAEMEHLVKDFGVREIALVGTTFTVNRERTLKFLELLRKKNLKLAWTCSTRVDSLDRDLLRLMKEAGCWSVRLGIESGNEEVLKFIRKGITREQVRDVVGWCQELGIHTKGFFMVGHLIDNAQTIRDSIDFALSLPLTDITVQINTPLPNTPQYRQAAKYGTLDEKDFSRFSFFEPVYVPNGMTQEELVALHREFYRRFYWRLSTLRLHLKKIMHLATLKNYIKAANLIFFLSFQKRWVNG